MNLEIKQQITHLIDQVYDLADEILNGDVPALINVNHMHALCLAANFDEYVCTENLREFHKVSFYDIICFSGKIF